MAQHVCVHRLAELCALSGDVNDAIELAGRERVDRIHSRENTDPPGGPPNSRCQFMSKMDMLKTCLPTGVTEGDRQLFNRVVVTPEQLPEVLAMPSRSPGLFVANKSEGKAATC